MHKADRGQGTLALRRSSATEPVESEFLEALEEAGLTAGLHYAAGLLEYLGTQGLATDCRVLLPNLTKVSRTNYWDHGDRVIVQVFLRPRLRKTFNHARGLVGRKGLCRIRHIDNTPPRGLLEAVTTLIELHAQAWSTEHDGDIWYSFKNRKNCLVNAAEKVFSRVTRCPLDGLAEVIWNSLGARTSRVKEYPDKALIAKWIRYSGHFTLDGTEVSFEGDRIDFTPIKRDILAILERAKAPMTSRDLTAKLKAKGHGDANIQKQVFRSPPVYVDREGGRGNFTYASVATKAAEARVEPPQAPLDADYERFRAALEELASTSVSAQTMQRREQRLLSQ